MFVSAWPYNTSRWLPWVLLSQHLKDHLYIQVEGWKPHHFPWKQWRLSRVSCPVAPPFICSLPVLLFLTLTDLFAASVNNCESTVLSSFLLCILSHFYISRFLVLFHVLLQSCTETQRVLSLTLLTQHEKTCVCVCVRASSKALLQCYNNRCNGHHDSMNLSSVYCVCWTITDRLADRWTDGLKGTRRVFGRLILPVNGCH